MNKYNLEKGLNSEILYKIGHDIRERRIAIQVSQKLFAQLVRMHPSNYCKFELGKLNISLKQFLLIKDKLEILEKVKSINN